MAFTSLPFASSCLWWAIGVDQLIIRDRTFPAGRFQRFIHCTRRVVLVQLFEPCYFIEKHTGCYSTDSNFWFRSGHQKTSLPNSSVQSPEYAVVDEKLCLLFINLIRFKFWLDTESKINLADECVVCTLFEYRFKTRGLPPQGHKRAEF